MIVTLVLVKVVIVTLVREVIPKKAASFWTLSKGGVGSNPNQKVWGYFFWGLLLDITEERGGIEPIPKVLG